MLFLPSSSCMLFAQMESFWQYNDVADQFVVVWLGISSHNMHDKPGKKS